MKFRSSGIVGVPAGNNTAPAWTAAAYCQVGIDKPHAGFGQRVDIWSLNHRMTVCPGILR